ncbi:lipocalin-like domain-containing protein [Pseudoduganella violacea]|uniref:Putative secreted hydrolase n=1 Tax=Pseudoduganella violacea TaxID=1715466 RepID=A0A7W5BBG5_9BURK|nr:carotenoid 1,2-hydratase [Pseudoduganella violacea]MBB3120076.1 putative secreted hydrolase [Pseudoduganella violacea]
MRILLALLLLFANAIALTAPPQFTPVTPLAPGKTLDFPHDFGAHPGFKTEWWYATGWLTTADGKALGYQVTFFRSATGHDPDNPSRFAPKQLVIGHAALSDPAIGKLLHDQRSAREGFGLAFAKEGNTDVKIDHWRMRRGEDGNYQVDIDAADFSLHLQLAPSQKPLLQGENGFSRKGPQPLQASYYYSEPQLRTSGSIKAKDGTVRAVSGVTWLDHEWSSQVLDENAAGWDWVGINLDDGGALMAFQIRSKGKDGASGKLWGHATWRDASGRITHYAPDQVSFTPQARWRSPRTNAEYPVATQIATGSTLWQVAPLQQDQELDSRRSTGSVYWEGAVTVSRDGKPVGRGYLELTGYARPMKL